MPIKRPFEIPDASLLISSGQLRDALAAFQNPRMKITRMLAAGELIPLRRGLYLRNGRISAPSVAPAIYGPSYVSFETALSWHGLIPERVEEILCAAIKRPARFDTPVGHFRYRHVPARVFPIGIERVDDGELPWLLASPTKALCDRIAMEPAIRSRQDVRAWLESMRIEEVPALEWDQLAACAEHYRRPSVRQLASYVRKNFVTQ